MDMQHIPPVEQPELRLAELLTLLKRRRWRILVFAAVGTLLAGGLGLLVQKSYKATIVISPASSPQAAGPGMGMSALLSQFGGLASLAGLTPGGDTKHAESLAVLQSELLTEKYIQENDLLPVLFPKAWDSANRRWRATDPEYIPTLWEGNRYFKKEVRTVLTDSKTGIVTLTISWRDPKVAAKWANDLVAIANGYLRKKAIDESERNIRYLNEQAARTDVVAVKQAIYAILQSEINKEMLARGNEEYAFKILDPARAPERPSTPPVWFMMVAAFVGSLVLSTLIGFVYVCWIRV